MNRKFWDKFYKKAHTNEHSDFMEFCAYYLKPKSKVVDFGCGNGRDSFSFAKLGHKVTGVDRSCKPKNNKNATFFQQDIRQFIKKRVDTFDAKYCRLLFHAIEDDAIDSILAWVRKGYLFIEARDKSDKSFKNDHERNLQHYPTLLRKLGKNGFTVIESEVAQGLAIKGEEDPMIIRIVAEKVEKGNKKQSSK